MRTFLAVTIAAFLAQTSVQIMTIDHVVLKDNDVLTLGYLIENFMNESLSLAVDQPSKAFSGDLLASASPTRAATMPSFRREARLVLNQARLYGRLASGPTVSSKIYAGVTSKKNGVTADQCDSLLFSGLAIYADMTINGNILSLETSRLAEQRLGRDLVVVQDFIRYFSSQDDGAWVRHPQCAGKSISRDMAHGVALVQVALRGLERRWPFNHDVTRALENLRAVNRVSQDKSLMGLFLSPPSRTDLLTSLVNPTIVEMLFPGRGIMMNDLILIAPEPRGYVTHLNALAILFELESLMLDRPPRTLHSIMGSRSRLGQLERLLNLTRAVEATSPKNILFKAIRFRVTAAIMDTLAAQDVRTHEMFKDEILVVKLFMALHLIGELRDLEIQGLFPAERLPNSSDAGRFEEYLWQRSENTWISPTKDLYEWPGVDYMMMAAMIMALSS